MSHLWMRILAAVVWLLQRLGMSKGPPDCDRPKKPPGPPTPPAAATLLVVLLALLCCGAASAQVIYTQPLPACPGGVCRVAQAAPTPPAVVYHHPPPVVVWRSVQTQWMPTPVVTSPAPLWIVPAPQGCPGGRCGTSR